MKIMTALLFLVLSSSAIADTLGRDNLPYGTDGTKVVGQHLTQSMHCFVFDGVMHFYDYPGRDETGCSRMNNVGTGIGEAHNSSATAGTASVKFKIDLVTGAMTSLSFTGPIGTTAWGALDIDDANNLLVQYTQRVYDPAKRAYVTKSKACISNGACTYTYPDYPGARSTYHYAFNNVGNTVGIWYDTVNKQRGFIFYKSTGTFQSIDYSGAIESTATGINDSNVVAGYYCFNKPSSYCEQSKGFTWAAGDFVIYDKGYSTMLMDIGNNGIVVGQVQIGNKFYKETFGFLE